MGAALARASTHRRPGRICLIHADFRTGNYLVHEGELAAILDWEFAAFGDPHEDLGWMLVRYWRFGADEREAGGIGSRAGFLDGYEAAADWPVDRAVVPYWEVMGTVRWAVIALMQAARHFRAGEESLELALTAHVLPVLELDLLNRIREIEEGTALSWLDATPDLLEVTRGVLRGELLPRPPARAPLPGCDGRQRAGDRRARAAPGRRRSRRGARGPGCPARVSGSPLDELRAVSAARSGLVPGMASRPTDLMSDPADGREESAGNQQSGPSRSTGWLSSLV